MHGMKTYQVYMQHHWGRPILPRNPKLGLNSKSLHLYLDGKLLQPKECEAPISSSTISRLLMGARYCGEKITDVFLGKLFGVKIYVHTDDFGIDQLISNYDKRAIVERDNAALKGHWPLINDGYDVSFLLINLIIAIMLLLYTMNKNM